MAHMDLCGPAYGMCSYAKRTAAQYDASDNDMSNEALWCAQYCDYALGLPEGSQWRPWDRNIRKQSAAFEAIRGTSLTIAHVVVSENVFIAIEDGLHTVLSAKLMEQHFEGFVVILDAIYKVSVDGCRPDYDQQQRKVHILNHMMKYLTE